MPRDKFDLASAILGIVSESDTGAPEVRMIPLVDIIPNPANFYAIDKKALRPLMDSIAMDGLHHYPLVMKHPKEEGKWQLIDGERRYTACRELVKEGHEEFKSIPCTVREYASTALAELQLILSNSTNRVLSNAEIMKQAEKTELLFYQLKEEGYEFPGRMRDQVAVACHVSATKLARLKVIREELFREYLDLFEEDKLSEQTAYALARMPEDFQWRLYEVTNGSVLPGAVAEQILDKLRLGSTWSGTMLKCPSGIMCTHADAFLRHDIESHEEMCGGNKCCLDCEWSKDEFRSCKQMCSEAEELRRAERQAAKASIDDGVQKAQAQNRIQSSKNAMRLLKAIDAADLDDDEFIEWGQYGNGMHVETVRKLANGDYPQDMNFYAPQLSVSSLSDPVAIAKLFQCSTDFLFGLTDELNPGKAVPPAEGWVPLLWIDGHERPTKEGQYVAKFRIKGEDAQPMIKLAFWKNFGWCFNNGATIDAECIGWWPIPEDE